MNKALSFKEILVYGFFISVFVFAFIYLLAIQENVSEVEYYHEYRTEFVDPSTVRIGVLASEGKDQVSDNWDETAAYLNSVIFDHTFVIVPLDYNEVTNAVSNEEVDFVFVNSALYVDLVVGNGAKSIATVERMNVDTPSTSFGGVIFTQSDNDAIEFYEDIKTMTFGAVNIQSFGGYQMAVKEFMDYDIDPLLDFTSVTFENSHYDVVYKVLDGTYDAGTVRTGVLEEMIDEGLISGNEIKVLTGDESVEFPLLVSTQLYPEWPMVQASHITDELGVQVANALMEMEETEQAAIDSKINGWTISSNYQDVHTTLKLISAEPYDDFGKVSFHNSIYYNRVFLLIILVAAFIIISFVLWQFHTRSALLEATKYSQDMEKLANQANEAKGTFLANMSHEIRTPMSAIIGLSTLIENTDLTARQRDYNHKLKSSAENLLGIIENILDYSKIDANKMKIEEIEFNLNDVLDNLSNVVTLQANDKGIEFLYDIPLELPKRFIGDPLRLGQVLINIAMNAIKFTDKGQVVLQIKKQELENVPNIVFSIIDSGIGMTQEQIKKILHPFTQADSSFTRRYGGTGLGLTITNQLIELMGGKLKISSKKDRGSTFSFAIPLQHIENKKKEYAIPDKLIDLKIMVIDDNETSLKIMGNMCKSLQFETKMVSSQDEAIEMLDDNECKPDVIVIDYNMPGMNGIDFIKVLKKKKSFGGAHVVLMVSAFGKDNVVQKAEKTGITEFLDKPINPSLFYDIILSLFNEKKFIPTARSKTGDRVNLVKPGTSIILAEDNKINQQIVGELLTREGFAVTIANNGLEVLEILEKDEFDFKLILMDIQMPLLNGREATKVIRETKTKYQRIPVIAMTAHALEAERQKCFEVGMNDFLTKPLEIENMFKALSKYIDIVSVSVSDNDVSALKFDFLDTKKGMENMGGDEGLYLEILYTFFVDYKELDSSLDHMYHIDEKDDLLMEVHTLKGLAATIGATELHKHSITFEKKLEEDIYDNDSFTLLIESLRQLISSLDEYFEKNPFIDS